MEFNQFGSENCDEISYNENLVINSMLLDNNDEIEEEPLIIDKKSNAIHVIDRVNKIKSSRSAKMDHIDQSEDSCHPVRLLQKWISKFLCSSRTTKEIVFDIRSMESLFNYDTPFVYPILNEAYAENIMIQMRGTIFTEKTATIRFISHCLDECNKQDEFEDFLIRYYCHQVENERRELIHVKKSGVDSVLVALCILIPAFLCGYFFWPDPDNDPDYTPGFGRIIIGILVWVSIW